MAINKIYNDFPSIIAHRGFSAEAPENTLASFKMAARKGLRWVECDVRLSKDGVPMVFHDDHLRRTTNSAGLFSMRAAKELQRLDAGSWFNSAFSGEVIPTLEQVLKLANKLDLGINIEVKPNRDEDERTVEAIACLLMSLNFQPRLLFSSYSTVSVQRCLELMPEYPRALVISEFNDGVIDDALAMKCSSLHIHSSLIDSEVIRLCYEHDLDVLCFTVNSCSLAEQCFAKDIVSIFSDNGLQSKHRPN